MSHVDDDVQSGLFRVQRQAFLDPDVLAEMDGMVASMTH